MRIHNLLKKLFKGKDQPPIETSRKITYRLFLKIHNHPNTASKFK